ncbi:hypothetical protein GCM10007424_09120 [Flavobacterium suaedae]|uniref:Adenylosuccinate lyase n=1 Tax=Flavobacterium suaedae TaxID=1767027 RepID=A0ABQ1JKF0_9FLAO|nr:hypothetical protein [Flavobacterium suaedae]GGB71275.1 hypothetical protein GCM10007424_09120 [Flavobacterium suaedae]
MNFEFTKRLSTIKAYRNARDEFSEMVLQDKALLPEVFAMAVNIDDENHHKACWILELIFEVKIEWLQEFLDEFCKTLPKYRDSSAIRTISKVCLFAVQENEKNTSFLDSKHIQVITEACFDWLINPDEKVAAKAYAMRALYILGKKQDWIYPELKHILPQNAGEHTAAYKAAAKYVLQHITKQENRKG